MLTFKKIWHGSIFAVATLMLVTSIGVQYAQDNSVNAQPNTCGGDAFIIDPSEGNVVDSNVEVAVHVDPIINGSAANADKVTITANSQIAGEATPAGTNVWEFDWDTLASSVSDGLVSLTARVHNGGSVICITDPVNVLVQNAGGQPVTGDFFLTRKSPLVQSWVGVTQIPKNFRVEARFRPDGQTNSNNVTDDAIFNWRLGQGSVGFLEPERDNDSIDYFTGPNPGTAILLVDAEFNGYQASKAFNITVETSAGTNYPELDEDEVDDLLNEIEDEEVNNTQDRITSAGLNEILTSDPDLTSCLSSVIGQSGYEAIVAGERRLSFSELRNSERCFVSTRFLLPANVAPIAPERIREIREDNRTVSVGSVETAASRGLQQEGIVLSGVTAPDQSVVVYVFSEPLVLTTSSDSDGNWTYVLEDPLEPGEHEVFVAVEDSSGEAVRSSAFTFSVAQAASIESNPSGLSLTLDLSDPGQNSTIYYVSAVAAVMLVGLGLYVFIIRRKSHLLEAAEQEEATKVD